jgi:hypothetical protein
MLQKEYEKTKSQRDMEEKYIVSAWYNMVREHISKYNAKFGDYVMILLIL